MFINTVSLRKKGVIGFSQLIYEKDKIDHLYIQKKLIKRLMSKSSNYNFLTVHLMFDKKKEWPKRT